MIEGNSPKAGDLVIVQISKIMPFGAYCKLLEYENIDAFLPIKEVSSGWIKNIHEFIREGQKVVCKIIYVDNAKNSFDISLKKVTPRDSKGKINAYNLEKRAEGIVSQALKKSRLTAQSEEIIKKIHEEFGNVSGLIYYINDMEEDFKKSKSYPQKFKEQILEIITLSKRDKRHAVSYILTLSTYNTLGGATELRSILSSIIKEGVEVKYISAPKYRILSEDVNYVKAEQKIKNVEILIKSKLTKGIFEMEKERVKKEKEDIITKNM